ncbi:hypothetical protein BCL69_100868 [Nitrosomonas communis]|uniref:Uncharacterized protein n=1 Tax=Nitrosomonas communis TaxID=44574 RepID=A0A0F7KGR4_9PROT|nr:hypothetical protein AAW31_09675 [Nitrosomonas communis]TYP91639.1 hypothetical protein BCL69_100868 [Nitrosomonas communis]
MRNNRVDRRKVKTSIVRDMICFAEFADLPYMMQAAGGQYIFGVWLEEGIAEPEKFFILFLYW